MTPQRFLSFAITPALTLLPSGMSSLEARAFVLAICLQESALTARRQHGGGPAKGYAQFELGGGVTGVLTHRKTASLARDLCMALDVTPTPRIVYDALEYQDILAAAFARLLLWTDPDPLPPEGEDSAAWDIYLRTWRPGRPRPDTWAEHYAEAWRVVRAAMPTVPTDVSGAPMTDD